MPESNIPIKNPPDSDEVPLSVDINIMHDSETDRYANNSVLRIQETTLSILRDHDIRRGSVSVAVVDDETIHKLNNQYLQHDYETDVLSFVLEYDEETSCLEGEVIVSLDTAVRVAKEIGSNPADELLLYIVHGTLHLVGFGDKEVDDKKEMRLAEQKYMLAAGAQYHAPSEDDS